MTEYVASALFVYSDNEGGQLENRVQNNSYGVAITTVAFNNLIQEGSQYFEGVGHVVVSGSLDQIKAILAKAITYQFSVGLLPDDSQKDLIKLLGLPRKVNAMIELALRRDVRNMDLIQCNGKIVLFKATVGWLPLLDVSSSSKIRAVKESLEKLNRLKPQNFTFSVANREPIKTAATGCMIIQHHKSSTAAKLIAHDNSAIDGMISLVISSPFSKIQYYKFLLNVFWAGTDRKKLPEIIGYIKSPVIDIGTDIGHDVYIDGSLETQTPLHCETIAKAVRVNVGDWLKEEHVHSGNGKEKIKCENLPDVKERVKITEKKLPFFSSASEERFRELFMALREDARINDTYLVLMVLSSLLATVGLYLDSAAVIIGAMLLAPLMTPIVSLAMGLLRQEATLQKTSLYKIGVGICIALISSALISLLFPQDQITDEMRGRINPNLLDLAVAIISGIAGAYSKAYREIIQSLAGVSIAVALVPPLAVSGIGLGRGDFNFFLQAFLLFSTNLVGIVLAATLTFRVLGYSPVIHGKRSIGVVILSLMLIMVPLYLSYDRIVSQMNFENRLKTDRFLVNGKYIIIQSAQISRYKNKKVIVMQILARETLTRSDMNTLKQKIRHYFDIDMAIRINIFYIL